MQDLFYLAVSLLFFGVAFAYIRGCDRLRPDGDADA